MQNSNVIGIDLAKNVIQVCKIDKHGELISNKGISPGKVKAFLQEHKTDANDALAVAIASTQFGMVFSQIKAGEQQSLQTLETSRKFLDKELTALNNHIRAYLYEYGITMNKGQKSMRETIAVHGELLIQATIGV